MKIENMKLILNAEQARIAYDAVIEATDCVPTNSDEDTAAEAALLMQRSSKAMQSDLVSRVLLDDIEAAFEGAELERTDFAGLCGIEIMDEGYNVAIRYEEDDYTQSDLLLVVDGVTYKVDLAELGSFGQADLVAI